MVLHKISLSKNNPWIQINWALSKKKQPSLFADDYSISKRAKIIKMWPNYFDSVGILLLFLKNLIELFSSLNYVNIMNTMIITF